MRLLANYMPQSPPINSYIQEQFELDCTKKDMVLIDQTS